MYTHTDTHSCTLTHKHGVVGDREQGKSFTTDDVSSKAKDSECAITTITTVSDPLCFFSFPFVFFFLCFVPLFQSYRHTYKNFSWKQKIILQHLLLSVLESQHPYLLTRGCVSDNPPPTTITHHLHTITPTPTPSPGAPRRLHGAETP